MHAVHEKPRFLFAMETLLYSIIKILSVGFGIERNGSNILFDDLA